MKDRLWGLDIFRIISAFIVFLFHSYIGKGIDCKYGILDSFISMGAIFMTAFFMLSGFSLYYVYEKKSLLKVNEMTFFHKKRFISIMPLYYCFALIYIFTLGNESIIDNLILSPIELLGLQSVFSTIWDRSHNGGTWFISCLVICYMVYPFIQEVIKQISSKMKLIIAALCVAILLWSPFIVYRFHTFFIYHNPFFRILEFTLGVLLASFFGIVKNKKQYQFLFFKKIVIVEFLLLISLVSLAVKLDISPGNYMLYSWIGIPLFSVIILSLAGVKKIGGVSSKVISYLSSISYAFFLAQFFTWDIMRFLIIKYNITSNIIRIIMCTVLVLIISSMMHLLIEKPITKYLKSKIIG